MFRSLKNHKTTSKLSTLKARALILLVRLMAWMPYMVSSVLVTPLAFLAYRLLTKRAHVARTNLSLCFPKWSKQHREMYVKRVFFQFCKSLNDAAVSWCRPPQQLPICHIRGLHWLQQAHQQGQGILLVGGHFSALELAGAHLARKHPLDIIYRPHNNQLIDAFINRSRRRYARNLWDRKNLRGVIRSLQEGAVVWYAPDQDFGLKNSVFSNFFNIPTATLTTIGRLSTIGNAKVLSLFFYQSNGQNHIEISNELNSIPSGCIESDAQAYNQWLEGKIRRYPDQYLWLHRRFKSRPKGEKNPYHRNSIS